MGLQEMNESEMDAATVHERLVAYVHALGAEPAGRRGVWVEHSYARAGGGRPDHKELLAAPLPSAPLPGEPLDVGGPEDEAGAELDADQAVAEQAEGDWEAALASLAPSAAAARLAGCATAALRALRLASLAGGGGRRAHQRAAALRLRRAMAHAAAGGAKAAAAASAWLGGALAKHLPKAERGPYAQLLAELHAAAPEVAARLGYHAPAPPSPPAPPASDAGGPALLWLSVGLERLDERWLRRLRPLLPTRVVRAEAPASAPPERWAGALAASARPALAAALGDAGPEGAVLAGAGASAALAAALAAGAEAGRLRGLVLLAPPLHTAEGACEPDDAAPDARLPVLLVAGAGGGRAAALEAGAGPARRLLLVAGADAALRLPAAHRARLALPQHALDAAVAEEVSRWVGELGDVEQEALQEASEGEERAPRPPPRCPPRVAPSSRAIEIIGGDGCETTTARRGETRQGRVVSRGSGATPLALMPPRRASPLPPAQAPPPAPAPSVPAPALAAADIMQLPIVFADDEPPAPAEPEAPVTVTSGGARARSGLQYTRVIVAKRAAGGRPSSGARPVLVRRVLPRR